jgi:predicted DCC family thiol-disulfide oxidoreductase YuxK
MSADAKSTVYYNSACPVCRSGIAAQQSMMSACEIAWIDVHTDPHAVDELGVALDDVRERLYVRDTDGRLQVGADAITTLWRQTPGLRWLGRFGALPLIGSLAQRLYDAFARRLYAWNRRLGRW